MSLLGTLFETASHMPKTIIKVADDLANGRVIDAAEHATEGVVGYKLKEEIKDTLGFNDQNTDDIDIND